MLAALLQRIPRYGACIDRGKQNVIQVNIRNGVDSFEDQKYLLAVQQMVIYREYGFIFEIVFHNFQSLKLVIPVIGRFHFVIEEQVVVYTAGNHSRQYLRGT